MSSARYGEINAILLDHTERLERLLQLLARNVATEAGMSTLGGDCQVGQSLRYG